MQFGHIIRDVFSNPAIYRPFLEIPLKILVESYIKLLRIHVHFKAEVCVLSEHGLFLIHLERSRLIFLLTPDATILLKLTLNTLSMLVSSQYTTLSSCLEKKFKCLNHFLLAMYPKPFVLNVLKYNAFLIYLCNGEMKEYKWLWDPKKRKLLKVKSSINLGTSK